MNNFPGRAEVEQVLSRIYSEFENAHEPADPGWLEKILNAISKFFKGLGTVSWVFLILGVSALIAFIVYRVVNSVSRDNPADVDIPDDESEDFFLDIPSAEYLGNAGRHAEKKEYSEAVVSLYRASISSMIEAGAMLRETGATNREIMRKIRNNDCYYKNFRVLATLSEHVLFNEETLNEHDYRQARESYQRGFM